MTLSEAQRATNQDPAKIQAALDFLDMGEKLVKYGRLGNAKPKWVNVRKGRLYWGLFSQPSSSADSSFISLADVQAVRLGKVTEVFARKIAATVPEDQCFSLILKNRSVDFQADSADSANVWVESLNIAVAQAKQEAHAAWLAKKRAEALETRISLTGKSAADTLRLRSGTVERPTQGGTLRLPSGVSMSEFARGGTLNLGTLPRAAAAAGKASFDDIANYMQTGGLPRMGSDADRSYGPGDDSDSEQASTLEAEEEEDEQKAAPAGGNEVDPAKEPVLPTVIANMARRGSVALMAANMQRNMERQQRMQNQMLLQSTAAAGAPANPSSKK